MFGKNTCREGGQLWAKIKKIHHHLGTQGPRVCLPKNSDFQPGCARQWPTVNFNSEESQQLSRLVKTAILVPLPEVSHSWTSHTVKGHSYSWANGSLSEKSVLYTSAQEFFSRQGIWAAGVFLENSQYLSGGAVHSIWERGSPGSWKAQCQSAIPFWKSGLQQVAEFTTRGQQCTRTQWNFPIWERRKLRWGGSLAMHPELTGRTVIQPNPLTQTPPSRLLASAPPLNPKVSRKEHFGCFIHLYLELI